MSVNPYEYYAVNISTNEVVHGIEPDFEEVRVIANSYEQFLVSVMVGKILL